MFMKSLGLTQNVVQGETKREELHVNSFMDLDEQCTQSNYKLVFFYCSCCAKFLELCMNKDHSIIYPFIFCLHACHQHQLGKVQMPSSTKIHFATSALAHIHLKFKLLVKLNILIDFSSQKLGSLHQFKQAQISTAITQIHYNT